MLTDMYKAFLSQQASLWPWSDYDDQNLHSDGSHGLFNEMMRDHSGHVCFAGPEAVNYLSPGYPVSGACDTSSYVNIPKLLDLATGGKYKWGTAKEVKEKRAAAAKAKAMARGQPRHSAAASAQSLDAPPPISFDRTNVNVCWFQQVDVLRDWWAVAEHKRHLGFAGRMVLGFSLEASVPPNGRRNGGKVLEALQTEIWRYALETCGPKAPPQSAVSKSSLRPETSAVMSEAIYQEVASVRADRQRLKYALRAALGKWEYWFCSIAFFNNLIEAGLSPRHTAACISDNALKCALRFLDQRLLFGSRVLQTEIDRKFHGDLQRPTVSQLTEADEKVAEVLRAMPGAVLTHSAMQGRLAAYRRRQQESAEDVSQRRRAVWERAEALGLGQIQTQGRSSEAFCKFPRSAELDSVLQRLGVPTESWLPCRVEPQEHAELPVTPSLPSMSGGARGAAAKPKAAGKPKAQPKAKAQAHAAGARGPGRPAKDAVNPYTVVSTELVQPDQDYQGAEDFLRRQKEWAASLVPGKVVRVRHQWYPVSSGHRVLLWCNSCQACQGRKGWRGYVTYKADTREQTREFTPLTCHGDFAVLREWSPLTSTTEARLREKLQHCPRASLYDLQSIISECQPAAVADQWLRTWAKHHRPRSADQKRTAFAWARSDWDQLTRDFGTLDALLEDPPATWPDALKVVAADYHADHTCVVFVNPALFAHVLEQVTNKDYIKLCGDGTFRLVRGEWVLLTLGVLSKHYARASSVYAFRTTFTPLMFALASKESSDTYGLLLRSACHCASKLAGLDFTVAVRQYHADWHKGEEVARRTVLENSVRVADFAHLTGACRRSRHEQDIDVAGRAWRAGIFSTVRRHLSPQERRAPAPMCADSSLVPQDNRPTVQNASGPAAG